MIRVFPSLEHSGGACPHSARQFVGLLCSTYLCSRKKHNRAKPMSELLSALISIADSSEFRFARFNIVYEGAQLVLPESPPIVSGVSDMCPPVCPNVEETRNQLQSSGWKKCRIFCTECSSCFSPGIWHAVLPAILFTPEEPCMPPVKTTICFLSSKQDFYDMLFFCIQLFDPLLFDPHGICCPRFRFQLLFIAEDTFYPLFFTLALFRI